MRSHGFPQPNHIRILCVHPGWSTGAFFQDLQTPGLIGVKMSDQNVLDILWRSSQLHYRRQNLVFTSWNSCVNQCQHAYALEEKGVDVA